MSSDRSGLAARGERLLPARSLQEEVGRGTEEQADTHTHTHTHSPPSSSPPPPPPPPHSVTLRASQPSALRPDCAALTLPPVRAGQPRKLTHREREGEGEKERGRERAGERVAHFGCFLHSWPWTLGSGATFSAFLWIPLRSCPDFRCGFDARGDRGAEADWFFFFFLPPPPFLQRAGRDRGGTCKFAEPAS